MGAVPRLVEPELVEELVLLEEWQELHTPAQEGLAILAADVGGKMVVGGVEVVQGESDLLEVVDRLGAPGRDLRRVHGRHQHGDGDRNGRGRIDRRNRLTRDKPDPLVIHDQRMDRRKQKWPQASGSGMSSGSMAAALLGTFGSPVRASPSASSAWNGDERRNGRPRNRAP